MQTLHAADPGDEALPCPMEHHQLGGCLEVAVEVDRVRRLVLGHEMPGAVEDLSLIHI